MKKLITLLSLIGTFSFVIASDVSPVISIRYNDFTGTTGTSISHAIGLNLNIDDNRFVGFDNDVKNGSWRIFTGWKFGKLGLGTATNEDGSVVGQYTAGTSVGILDNLNLDLDYVITDGSDDTIRLSFNINF